MNDEAARLVERLHLAPLPHEGGFFRRIWTAPTPADGRRPAASAILFLLTSSDFSALHRLASEEVWFFQAGDPVAHVQLIPGQPDPLLTTLHSPAGDPHASPQVAIPSGTWQGARLLPGASSHGWALVTCVVTPAWSDADFTLGDRSALLREFPSARDWILALTR